VLLAQFVIFVDNLAFILIDHTLELPLLFPMIFDIVACLIFELIHSFRS